MTQIKCNLCHKDLTTPSRMFGGREVIQMHRQAHLAEWIERVYDLLECLEDGAGTLEEFHLEAGQRRKEFEDWTEKDLFDVRR